MKRLLQTLLIIAFAFSSFYGKSIWEKYNLKNVRVKQKILGKIVALNGDMQIQKIGRQEIEDAKVGDIIHRGDIITQYAGESTIKLNSGATAKINGESQLFVDDDGFHLEHGKADFTTNSRADSIDAGHSKVLSKNAKAQISKGKNGLINRYFTLPDTIDVTKGSVSVKVPDGVKIFNVYYEESGKEIQTDRFILKEDEMAVFDGADVKIIKKSNFKKPLERDQRKRFFIGGELSGAYISRSLKNSKTSSESMGVLRPGINFTLMKRRVDPMYSLSITTDPEMEEYRFDLIYPRAQFYAESFWKTTPYYKVSLGFGNTHGDDFTPTHAALGLGYGWLKKVNDFSFLGDFIWFSDLNLKTRTWEFDRDGDARKQLWSEVEFSIQTKIMYRVR